MFVTAVAVVVVGNNMGVVGEDRGVVEALQVVAQAKTWGQYGEGRGPESLTAAGTPSRCTREDIAWAAAFGEAISLGVTLLDSAVRLSHSCVAMRLSFSVSVGVDLRDCVGPWLCNKFAVRGYYKPFVLRKLQVQKQLGVPIKHGLDAVIAWRNAFGTAALVLAI